MDFNDWPNDANELTVRLKGWFSLNSWLVDGANVDYKQTQMNQGNANQHYAAQGLSPVDPIENNGTPVRDRIGNAESWLSDCHQALDRLEKRLDTILTPVPPMPPTTAANQALSNINTPRSHVQGRLEILNEGYAHLASRMNALHQRIEL